MDEFQIAQCRGKEAFSDPQIARRVLQRMKHRVKFRHGKQRTPSFASREVYRCNVCSQWHIGTPSNVR